MTENRQLVRCVVATIKTCLLYNMPHKQVYSSYLA